MGMSFICPFFGGGDGEEKTSKKTFMGVGSSWVVPGPSRRLTDCDSKQTRENILLLTNQRARYVLINTRHSHSQHHHAAPAKIIFCFIKEATKGLGSFNSVQ